MLRMDVKQGNETLFIEGILQHSISNNLLTGFDNKAVACINRAFNESAALLVLLSDMVKLIDGVNITDCGEANREHLALVETIRLSPYMP